LIKKKVKENIALDIKEDVAEKSKQHLARFGLIDDAMENQIENHLLDHEDHFNSEVQHHDHDVQTNDTFIMNSYAHPVERFMLDRPVYFKRVS
jgi:hypothetical protein